MSGYRTFLKLGELSDGSMTGMYKDGIEIDSCIYAFEQGIDEKGKVQTDVMGGSIAITINGFPSDAITKWGVESRTFLSGVIVLYDDHGTPIEKTFFEEAACVAFKLNFERDDQSFVTTQLMLQAKNLKMSNAKKLENRWI